MIKLLKSVNYEERNLNKNEKMIIHHLVATQVKATIV